MDDSRTQTLRSAGSEMIGLLLLVPAIAGVFYVLQLFASKAGRILLDMVPDGTPLPIVTRLAMQLPFLLVGGVLAVLVLVFAFTLRKRLWVQRHLVLLVSIAWIGLGGVGLITLASFAIPLTQITTGLL